MHASCTCAAGSWVDVLPKASGGSPDGAVQVTLLGCMLGGAHACSGRPAGRPVMTSICVAVRTGMPIGLQLMGRPWGEASLLYAGSVLESAVAPLLKLPRHRYDVLHGRPA